MRAVLVLVLAVASCSPDPPTPNALAPAHDAVAIVEPAPLELEQNARAFDLEARDLRDVTVLEKTHDALVAIQATSLYQRHHHHERLDPELLVHATNVAKALADRLERGARRLRERDIANGIEEANRGVDSALKDSFGELPSQIVDELVFVRDDVCHGKTTDDACTQLDALHHGYDRARAIGDAASGLVRDAARSRSTRTTITR